MRIPNFEVIEQRSIRIARCERVPKLMVIAGPNGTGKSTLLNSIRTQNGYTDIMYVGPHRAMRRQQVQQRHLFISPISLENVLSSPNIPGFEGIQMFDSSRDPWNYDGSANVLKHALCQIEVDRQQAITRKVDRDGEILRGSLVDPWKPFKELTHNLLPHLSFFKIDSSNRDQVKVLWHVHGLETPIDLDELSSGEKSIIQMFYPIIEREIRAIVAEIELGPQTVTRPDYCILIDEPELHLHPNLQMKVLDYLRVLTSGETTQVIVATHSPTIVEYASFEELFLLRPVELIGRGENQLIQVANDEDRLTYLRDVFGSTSNLTALQPVVIVESIAEKEAGKVLADRKLYRALHSGFDSITIIPGGGKSEARSLLKYLGEALASFSPHLKAVALLDRDVDTSSPTGNIELLPVSMIENFLLDPNAIWETIQSVVERTSFRTYDDVEVALDTIIDNLEPAEISRRAKLILGGSHFYPHAEIGGIEAEVAKYLIEVQAKYSPEAITSAIKKAQERVDELRFSRRRREEFDGKSVLNEFYKRYLHSSGYPKVIFSFEAARHARRRKSVITFFDDFFTKIHNLENNKR